MINSTQVTSMQHQQQFTQQPHKYEGVNRTVPLSREVPTPLGEAQRAW